MSEYQPDQHQRIRRRAYQLWLDAGCPNGTADDHWRAAEAAEADDTDVEIAAEDSFPASDPPSYSGITGPG